jgi:hypothetical protein
MKHTSHRFVTARPSLRRGALAEALLWHVANTSSRLRHGRPARRRMEQQCTLVNALESIAHFAAGDAGVAAARALLHPGLWSPAVEVDARPHPAERWLVHSTAHIPAHDEPHPDAILDALRTGRRAVVAISSGRA